MTEHTPTPWKLCNAGECPCLMISCPDHPIAKVESGEWGDEYPAMRQVGPSLENKYEAYMERIGYGTIAPETARANAELIVKAVNNHDALVKALDDLAKCVFEGGLTANNTDAWASARRVLAVVGGGQPR